LDVDGAGEEGRGHQDEPAREPAIRAPLPALALSLTLIGLYAWQSWSIDPDAVVSRFAFSPSDLEEGRWRGLITALFVHGNWAHVLLNALGGLAFGAAVARLFGRRLGGAIAYFTFFLICGVLANLGFAALHPGASVLLIGASGGVSGLMGAASRLIERRNVLAPFTSRTVLGMAAAWIIANLLLGLVGLDAVSGGAAIAWEAHLAGYAAGLVLIGPAARLVRGGRGITKP
jgi:membrane associated rhomboid family serine protease